MSRKQSAKISDHFDDPVSILHTKRAIFDSVSRRIREKISPPFQASSRPAGKARIRWKISI